MEKIDTKKLAKDEGDHIAYRGQVFSIIVEEVASPEGLLTQAEFVSCADVVRVYPVDDADVLWLIRERRLGMDDGLILRTVSGSIEAGETPESAAKRELDEELGLDAQELVVFHTSTPMLKVRHSVYHVLARNIRTKSSHDNQDPFEDISPAPINVDDIESMVWNGELREDIIAFGMLSLARLLKNESK